MNVSTDENLVKNLLIMVKNVGSKLKSNVGG